MREADLHIPESSFEAMGIGDLLSLTRAAGLVELQELSCRGGGAVIQSTVETRYDEAALDDLDYVETWTHIAARDDAHVYVISFTAPDVPDAVGDAAEALIGTCEPSVGADGATMSLVGPQTAIAQLVTEYESAGVSPDLQGLTDHTGTASPLADLTERQREVIETAWEMGYYDVPRSVSTDAVAAELALDASTVTEHLQRAERNLLSTLL
ncbi:helix-turn-helix domain-containing protein [Halonotius terrestris]|uniref:Helix-turn-helix domain-containing protein n=1 Tax=Halonotius terrestris TaxID=2487750 RepID=A0A8J8PAQ9_9EURY|nr:helix-turn-helix domain-containing protein [Halonotius terrestris]TQQ79800.1 helix-turn-helix domain-containing protein [Halonotius terrestris]